MLRRWATLFGALVASSAWQHSAGRQAAAQEGGDGDPPARGVTIRVNSGDVKLRLRYDPEGGTFGISSLTAFGTSWVPEGSPSPALWIWDVHSERGPSRNIDGNGGLELVSSGRSAATLLHEESDLRIQAEWASEAPNAITHRLTIANARSNGPLYIGAAHTLNWYLYEGGFVETLAADDAEQQWTAVRRELPLSLGSHGSRNALEGSYPIARFMTEDGNGLIVIVDTATSWRFDALADEGGRVIRAGEYQTDAWLKPGERLRLPDVVTIFFEGGAGGAIAALRDYLEAVSAAAPAGWEATPPVLFNTWFGQGTDLFDDGSGNSPLRHIARVAAHSGIEVFVVDAGWYLGNPVPTFAGDRGQSGDKRPTLGGTISEDEDEEPIPPQTAGPQSASADDFDRGLGSWVENPEKWRARSGADGSRAAGLRNFSDYVRKLEVARTDGGRTGRMRFGLWVEPERFDPSFRGDRVPRRWSIPGVPVLDFSRSEVVDGITARMQKMINAYRVEYLKIDSNTDVAGATQRRHGGNFWTRWSLGYEQLFANLRRANPDLYIEHCASGLKRFWPGAMRYANATWLDDDVSLGNVSQILAGSDEIMLPRQKVVLIVESLSDLGNLDEALSIYAGGEEHAGGGIGFSSRVGEWTPEQEGRVREAVGRWKREVRGG